MNDRFRRERLNVPEFKVKMKKALPLNPEDCCACSLHEHNTLRAPVKGEGERPLLIINRALPKILAERGDHFTIPEEESLKKWLEAISLDYENDCVIAPLIFCPVKDPLNPGAESVSSCFPFLERLIDQTKSKAILVLGKEGADISSKIKNIPLFSCHHPSDVLIDPSLKRPVWEVLKRIKEVLVG